MSILDAHPAPKPGAHWPDGFRERAQAIADRVAAERNDHIGDAIAGFESAPEIVPEERGGRPSRVARVRLIGARPMTPSAVD